MPLSITDFMDIQLRKLARLCWLNLFSQPFNQLMEA